MLDVKRQWSPGAAHHRTRSLVAKGNDKSSTGDSPQTRKRRPSQQGRIIKGNTGPLRRRVKRKQQGSLIERDPEKGN